MRNNVSIESISVLLMANVDQFKQGEVLHIDPDHKAVAGRYILDGRKVYRWDGASKIESFRGCVVAVEKDLL